METAQLNGKSLPRFERAIQQLELLNSGVEVPDPDKPMGVFNSLLDTAARQPIEGEAQLRILHAGIEYLAKTEPDAPGGSLDDMMGVALAEAIAGAPDAMRAALLALARHKLHGGQIDLPTTPSTHVSSRALRRRFDRGLAMLRNKDEADKDLSDAEVDEGTELFWGTINDILRGGIRNDLELMIVHEGIEYEFRGSGIDHPIQDLIDYALYAAFENTQTWPYAWLIGLARFQLRGFNAKPWDYPERRFLRWIGEEA